MLYTHHVGKHPLCSRYAFQVMCIADWTSLNVACTFMCIIYIRYIYIWYNIQYVYLLTSSVERLCDQSRSSYMMRIHSTHVHCILYIVHRTLYIVLCRYSIQCVVYIVNITYMKWRSSRFGFCVHTYVIWHTPYTHSIHCTLYTVHCTLHSVLYSLDTECILYIVQTILYNGHSTVYNV